MTVAMKLGQYLDEQGVRFEAIPHGRSFTAQATAQAEHVPGRMEAKVVMVKLDGKDAMAVLPAVYRVDLEQLRKAAGAEEIRLLTEPEFARLFPDCEPGAMPPFGHLYGVPLFVDRALAENEEIVFNGGTHEDGVRMRFQDYARLAQPAICSFSGRGEWSGPMGSA